ncbi:hypothetical protein [Actinomadura sediminis]|uniref:Uncharacterized protein n=1 Tax=Actinomadura sediminis TaxID=1038904 RepID=A0ABW3EUQ6_9ACTN
MITALREWGVLVGRWAPTVAIGVALRTEGTGDGGMPADGRAPAPAATP